VFKQEIAKRLPKEKFTPASMQSSNDMSKEFGYNQAISEVKKALGVE